jgi:hypothetical protein
VQLLLVPLLILLILLLELVTVVVAVLAKEEKDRLLQIGRVSSEAIEETSFSSSKQMSSRETQSSSSSSLSSLILATSDGMDGDAKIGNVKEVESDRDQKPKGCFIIVILGLSETKVQPSVRIGYNWIYCKTWFGLVCCCSWNMVRVKL